MQYQERPLPFKRSRTSVSIEVVDESWALELINEAEWEDRIQTEDSDVESVRLEHSNVGQSQPLTDAGNTINAAGLEDTIKLIEVQKPVLEVVSGPSAIDIQKIQWSSRSQQCAETPDSTAQAAMFTHSFMFKSLLKRWMHA